MIALSRLRLALLSLLVFVAFVALAACDQACGTVGCQPGMLITLDDSYERGKTYDIVVNELTATPETVPLVRCAYFVPVDTSAPVLMCASAFTHTESGSTIQVRDWLPAHISVKVSTGDATLAEKTFDPQVVTREINGPGCGMCTNASVTISVPKPQATGA